MQVNGRWIMAGVLAAAMAVLSGCNEEEQGRILYQEKGVYQGAEDTGLDDETREDLRERARRLGS